MELNSKIKIRHSTAPKYAGLFEELVSSGFSNYSDCERPRTGFKKLLDISVSKSIADSCAKSITQRARIVAGQLGEISNTVVKYQVFKQKMLVGAAVGVPAGWYFCIIMVEGGTMEVPKTLLTEELRATEFEPASLVEASVCATVLDTPRELTPEQLELKKLYGDLYVPD